MLAGLGVVALIVLWIVVANAANDEPPSPTSADPAPGLATTTPASTTRPPRPPATPLRRPEPEEIVNPVQVDPAIPELGLQGTLVAWFASDLFTLDLATGHWNQLANDLGSAGNSASKSLFATSSGVVAISQTKVRSYAMDGTQLDAHEVGEGQVIFASAAGEIVWTVDFTFGDGFGELSALRSNGEFAIEGSLDFSGPEGIARFAAGGDTLYASPLGGGIFVREDGTWERIQDGFLEAANHHELLSYDCPESFDICSLVRLETPSGRVVAHHQPPPGFAVGSHSRNWSPDLRYWVNHSDFRVWDVVAEAEVEVPFHPAPQALPGWSTDGSWLAAWADGQINLLELVTGAHHVVDRPDDSFPVGPLFLYLPG